MTAVPRRLWAWLETRPIRSLLLAVALVVVLRLPFLTAPMLPDEGGFLFVADQWHGPGRWIYSNQWVDRPPLLIVVFKLASALGDDLLAMRLLSTVFALVMVAAAWWAGRVINGRNGALVAALVAAVLSSDYLLEGYTLEGEGIAATFVMVSCALTLHARYVARSDREAMALAAAAGLVATLAVLTKQNFIDGGLFAAVLIGLGAHRRWRLLLSGALGIAVPALATAWWAHSDDGPGVVRLAVALYQFRAQAAHIVDKSSDFGDVRRLWWVVLVAVATGVLLLIWHLAAALARVPGDRSLRAALLVMLGYAVLSMILGADWWRHYLLQVTPVLAMGSALAVRRTARWLRTELVVAFAVASALVVAAIEVPVAVAGTFPLRADTLTAGWLRAASRPGDSVVVLFGGPSIVEMSRLTTPYPYSWRLPQKVRDPHLTLLTATLLGPTAPTWVVQLNHLGGSGRYGHEFRQAVSGRYRAVAEVCHHRMWLLKGDDRPGPPAPTPC